MIIHKMLKKVYIASPYTIGNKERNVLRQIDVADKLMDLGFAPFWPLRSHYHHIEHARPYEDWMQLDFTWVLSCNAVLRLDGESEGADHEVEIAIYYGLPVFYGLEELKENFSA